MSSVRLSVRSVKVQTREWTPQHTPEEEPLLAKLANSDPFQPKIGFRPPGEDGKPMPSGVARRAEQRRMEFGARAARAGRRRSKGGGGPRDRRERDRERGHLPHPHPPLGCLAYEYAMATSMPGMGEPIYDSMAAMLSMQQMSAATVGLPMSATGHAAHPPHPLHPLPVSTESELVMDSLLTPRAGVGAGAAGAVAGAAAAGAHSLAHAHAHALALQAGGAVSASLSMPMPMPVAVALTDKDSLTTSTTATTTPATATGSTSKEKEQAADKLLLISATPTPTKPAGKFVFPSSAGFLMDSGILTPRDPSCLKMGDTTPHTPAMPKIAETEELPKQSTAATGWPDQASVSLSLSLSVAGRKVDMATTPGGVTPFGISAAVADRIYAVAEQNYGVKAPKLTGMFLQTHTEEQSKALLANQQALVDDLAKLADLLSTASSSF